MAKKTTKKVNNNELDGPEFFAAIAQIEQEKGIKPGYMMEKITQALVSAYRRDHEGVGDNLVVDANPETNTVRMFLKKDVVEEVDNPATEISLAEAQAALPRAQLGDVVRIEIKPKSFGRIAAQTARQVIIQASGRQSRAWCTTSSPPRSTSCSPARSPALIPYRGCHPAHPLRL